MSITVKKCLLPLGILACLAVARNASAWNGTGHEIVALIAWDDLTPQARENVTRLLKAHPDYADMLTKTDTPEADKAREAFLTAATWPDLVRTPGGKSYRYNHPVWHYVDMPFALGMDAPDMPDEKWVAGKDPANAAQAWQKCAADLQDAKMTDAERGIALCWIEHLCGDIHQPLHAISFFSERTPKGDQGGNLLMVRTGDHVSNLHALWDGMLGNDESFDNVSKTARQIREAHPRSGYAVELKAATFHRWVESSAERAKTVVYQEGTLPFLTRDEARDKSKPIPELPDGYMQKARETADGCAALAGYRLADRLNEWLGK
jgi:hypothetical protein